MDGRIDMATITQHTNSDQRARTHWTATCYDGTHQCGGWVAPLVYGVRECECSCHEQLVREPWQNAYSRARSSFYGASR
jgi:hypothetical protein